MGAVTKGLSLQPILVLSEHSFLKQLKIIYQPCEGDTSNIPEDLFYLCFFYCVA